MWSFEFNLVTAVIHLVYTQDNIILHSVHVVEAEPLLNHTGRLNCWHVCCRFCQVKHDIHEERLDTDKTPSLSSSHIPSWVKKVEIPLHSFHSLIKSTQPEQIQQFFPPWRNMSHGRNHQEMNNHRPWHLTVFLHQCAFCWLARIWIRTFSSFIWPHNGDDPEANGVTTQVGPNELRTTEQLYHGQYVTNQVPKFLCRDCCNQSLELSTSDHDGPTHKIPNPPTSNAPSDTFLNRSNLQKSHYMMGPL